MLTAMSCAAFSSCVSSRERIKESGNYVRKEIRVEHFDKMVLSGSPTVTFRQKSGKPRVEVYASDNLIDLLDIRVKKGTLMLGGFGIWYGTFAAVRARTREVGLKKAMGGSDTDILAQFLAEALCKSVAGGVLGILIGTLCVQSGAWALDTTISYTLLLISSLGSIVFSAFIGVAAVSIVSQNAAAMQG